MFTGLVEGQGTIREIRSEGAAVRLVIEAPSELAEQTGDNVLCSVGDSIAINGCCLTAVDVDGLVWAFEAGAETLSKTNLGQLAEGDPVNLECPLPVGGRLGGHFVQGHVDGIGQIESIEREGEWVTMWFRIKADLGRQMVSKGSVAIDGVSLTLVDVEPERFSVALIPHTLDVTTLGERRPGDEVNIETDILGKYVLKYMEAAGGRNQ